MLAEKRKRDQVEGQVLDQTNHSCNCIAQGEEEEGNRKHHLWRSCGLGCTWKTSPRKVIRFLGCCWMLDHDLARAKSGEKRS